MPPSTYKQNLPLHIIRERVSDPFARHTGFQSLCISHIQPSTEMSRPATSCASSVLFSNILKLHI
ncbi:unnamed protein product [Ixodes persulcatus]